MNRHSLEQYRQTQLLGMTQAELVVMLHQGAIRYLGEAIDLVDAERYDQSWRKFDCARRIVVHLCGTLNRDAGDLADKLSALYAFVIEQITVANARRDAQIARNCINILTTLKEGWEGIAVAPAVESAPMDEVSAHTTPGAAGTFCCHP
ncbi:MAG: flagellar protein FliS [candidate division Zixibacteria bacterium]|nr:flagellar protein FliS [candidate division Zixibacteria bacterium]